MDPSLLRHYEAELAYLRDMGAEFAHEFPKVAGRLDLANTEVADPFVERMLEGFAFLTARIQLKMEAEFPTFTQSLLQMAYPHYAAPMPAMAIVTVTPSEAIRTAPAGVVLPAGTELRSLLGTEDQTNCVFRTAHALRLLPIELAEAEYLGTPSAVASLGLDSGGAKAAIRLRLRSMGGIPIAKIALERLGLYLGGPETARMRLYAQQAQTGAWLHGQSQGARGLRPCLHRIPDFRQAALRCKGAQVGDHAAGESSAVGREGASFNHPVCAQQDGLRKPNAQRLRRLQVDDQLERVRLFDRQVRRTRTAKDLVDVARGAPPEFGQVLRIGREAAHVRPKRRDVNGGQASPQRVLYQHLALLARQAEVHEGEHRIDLVPRHSLERRTDIRGRSDLMRIDFQSQPLTSGNEIPVTADQARLHAFGSRSVDQQTNALGARQ